MISVIVPVLNEAVHLPRTLTAIRAPHSPHEVIVVDGGSADRSQEIAEAAGATVISSLRPQRAAQMNLGAALALGDVLLFLHADTLLPGDALARIESAVRDPATVGGGFARRYDSPSLFLRITCALAELRTRACGWFLGDQAIFVRRAVFEQLGGFRAWDLFEDLDFARRMQRCGRVVTLRPPVVSAARRFATRGPVRTTWRDLWLTTGYVLGPRPGDDASHHLEPARSENPRRT